MEKVIVIIPVISKMCSEQVIDAETGEVIPKPFVTHVEATVLASRHTTYPEDSSKNSTEHLVYFEVQVNSPVEMGITMRQCKMWIPASICLTKSEVVQ